jgi:hypothetical protein
MEKGTFAKYKYKIYKVSDIDGDRIGLVSEDQSDLNNGFKEKIYPSNYKNSANLPRLFISEVKKEEIDEIYEIDYKAKYKGNMFNLSFSKTRAQFKIGTVDAELAKRNGLERTDKYYYEKVVNKEEIEVLKITKSL